MPKQSKTLNYYRVEFERNSSWVLEDLILRAHNQCPTAGDRIFPSGYQEFKGCHSKSTDNGQLLHVTLVTPGEPVSTVPNDKLSQEINIKLLPPPENENFMDGDMFLLIKDNNLLFGSTGLKIPRAKEYLQKLFEKANLDETAKNFKIINVSDVDKVRMLQNGVKAISLNAGLYPASLVENHSEKKTISQRILGPALSSLMALFKTDPQLKDIKEQENITAELTIRFNRAKKGGEVGQKRMKNFSQKIIDEEDSDGFRIETFSSGTLTHKDIVIRKSVPLEKFGKSADYKEVWEALEKFYEELRETGTLEQ